MELREAMRTARSMRRFTDEPVDDQLLVQCLEAATWAPSGGNQQPWRFVVLESPETREAIQHGADTSARIAQEMYGIRRPDADDDSTRARNSRAMLELHDGARLVPAAVLFCVREQPHTPPLLLGSSIYPALQNFLLALREAGLGACLTGWQLPHPEDFRVAVGIPDDWHLAALVAVGWPKGNHGLMKRKPVAEVTFRDRWDHPFVT